jgi:uncharacterized SAM-binding protein YcdF (DUF218 family)
MYRFVTGLVDPVLLLFLLAAITLAALWRKHSLTRGRLIAATAAAAGLAGLCTHAAAVLALGSLEWQCPPTVGQTVTAQAIVVLAGNVTPPEGLLPRGALGDRTLYRCLHAVGLYRKARPCPVVVCGGGDDSSGPTAAEMMRDFLVEQGVARPDIVLEGRSTTTYQSAVGAGKLLRARGIEKIVLVTDAAHLPRSRACFAAQGLRVTPSGCYYRATRLSGGLLDFLPSAGAAAEVEQALHEWLGLAWYRLRGRI